MPKLTDARKATLLDLLGWLLILAATFAAGVAAHQLFRYMPSTQLAMETVGIALLVHGAVSRLVDATLGAVIDRLDPADEPTA